MTEYAGVGSQRFAQMLPIGGVALLASLVFYFALTDKLVILLGLAGIGCFLLLALRWPVPFLAQTIFFSIVLPPDLALDLGSLPRIGPSRVLLAVFFLAWVVRLLAGRESLRTQVAKSIGLAIAAYLLLGFASAFLSVSPRTSLFAVIGRDLLEQFLLFGVFICFLRRPGAYRSITIALALASAFVCGLAAVEAFTGLNPFLALYPDHTPDVRLGLLRVQSSFFHPIALASYVVLVLPLFALEVSRAKRTSSRILLWTLIAALALTMVLTLSRGPWMALGVEVLIFGWWWSRRRNLVRLLGACAAGVGMVAFVWAYHAGGAIHRLFSPFLNVSNLSEASSEFYRIILLRAVIDHMEGWRWLLGYGPNAFALAGINAHYAGHDHVLLAPDNHYIKLLLENGLLGLGAFLVILFIALRLCLGSLRQAPSDESGAALAGVVVVCGFAVVNATASMFQMYPLGTLFWYVIAVAIVRSQPERCL